MSPQVLIAGWLEWEPEDRRPVLDLFGPMTRRSLDEPGCIDYSMSPDPLHPGRVRVTELWESEQALNDHLAAEHTREFRQRTSVYPRTGRSLLKHFIAQSAPM